MADEPERRIIGVLAVELEQNQDIHTDGPSPEGIMRVWGLVDLQALAKAVLREVAG